jgi:hypothetical protein
MDNSEACRRRQASKARIYANPGAAARGSASPQAPEGRKEASMQKLTNARQELHPEIPPELK